MKPLFTLPRTADQRKHDTPLRGCFGEKIRIFLAFLAMGSRAGHAGHAPPAPEVPPLHRKMASLSPRARGGQTPAMTRPANGFGKRAG